MSIAEATAPEPGGVGALRHAESLARIQLEAEYHAEERQEKADLRRRLEQRKSKKNLLAPPQEDDAPAAPVSEEMQSKIDELSTAVTSAMVVEPE